jgi:hypothetical protein
MPSLRQLIVLSLLAATSKADFGPAFSTGPTASGIYIYSSTATLTLPDGPSDAGSGYDLSLWVGMGTSDGDLIQSITDNYSDDWTVFAYTLKETSPTSQEVIEGDVAPAAAGDEVTMVCKSNIPGHVVSRLCSSQWVDQYVTSTGNYTQTVYLNGMVVSTLSTSDGEAEGWGSAVECASNNCGTVPAHREFLNFLLPLLPSWPIFSEWTNVEIVLSAADPGYIDTMYLEVGAEAAMSTSDGGKTWNVGTISIPQYTF